MTDAPDADAVIGFDDLADPEGMPDRTERAFRSYYGAELEPSGKIERTIAEIERVYERDPDAVVSCSGGKDSMAVLALAAASDAEHAVCHWDYGPALIPRDVEQSIIEQLREYVPDERVFVANDAMRCYKRYQHATRFYEQLHSTDRVADTPSVRETEEGKPIGRARERLYRAVERDVFGRQLMGTRRGESGARERYIDGLFGESMGIDAAFPLRDWTAREVWSYIVAHDVPYPDHYDRVCRVDGDGSPEAYIESRMGGFFRTFRSVSVDDSAVHGIAEWDHQDVRMEGK